MRLFTAAVLVWAGPALAAEPITGRASVVDGDTLLMRDTRVRLHGIDAPESAQSCDDAAGKAYRCGQKAARVLAEHIGEGLLTCVARETDQHGRLFAVCRKDAEDLNAWMVAQGHAVALRRYSEEYLPQEKAALAAKRGLWAGVFEMPADWRRRKQISDVDLRPEIIRPETAKPKAAAPVDAAACEIKGSISGSGERIYYLPSSPSYGQTRIDEDLGERMFCSEREARAAGWRAASG